MKPGYIIVLIELLKLGAKDFPIGLTTRELASRIGRSQQAASLYLLGMEREGLVERIRSGNLSMIRLTPKGVDALRELYQVLKASFEGMEPAIVLVGELFSGYGEGAYYMSREGYRRQFREKLGFDPYPGTLNLRLRSPIYRRMREDLKGYPGILIEGFRDENRTFGWVRVLPAKVDEEVEGAALIAFERGHYDEGVIEVVAPERLRDRLGLKDGDLVRVRIVLEPRARS